jgi:Holliday junction DNA helicase RuvA
MIASVAGEVAVRRPGRVVIETASGVGYALAVSDETLRHVPATGRPTLLHTHLIVRDDALQLYGFASEEERDLFLLLIGVQSVGPKVALAVLSGGSPRELVSALAAGDVARLTAVPGIGKRTAERIVVELREKVDVLGTTGEPTAAGGPIVALRADDPRRVALQGLLELGFQPAEADALLAAAEGETPEDLLASALRAARS